MAALTPIERCLSLFTEVKPGDGRAAALLTMQAFTLMFAYYLIRPVREALILSEGTAELRSVAVGVQAVLLIILMPAYGQLVRRMAKERIFRSVMAVLALSLVGFGLAAHAGFRLGFAFFVWASLFAVLAVSQFWAFATDLLDVASGTRLFGILALGIAGGAWAGAAVASRAFATCGPGGLMLAAAATLAVSIAFSERARRSVGVQAAAASRAPASPLGPDHAGAWLGGLATVARSRYLVALAALVVLLNWITSTGDYMLSSWLKLAAAAESPADPAAWLGRFMGRYCATITLVGFLVQLLLVSRIIQRAGLARAVLVTPVVMLAGFCLVGCLPVFAVLQSVLIVQRSLDYSLLNTARGALLLPATREEKYEAKTAVDTLFYRLGDLLSTVGVFVTVRVSDDPGRQVIWLLIALAATMAVVAWQLGREYARRYGGPDFASARRRRAFGGRGAVAAQ